MHTRVRRSEARATAVGSVGALVVGAAAGSRDGAETGSATGWQHRRATVEEDLTSLRGRLGR